MAETYLSHERWEVLVLKDYGKDLFCELCLVYDIECTPRICPRNRILVLIAL